MYAISATPGIEEVQAHYGGNLGLSGGLGARNRLLVEAARFDEKMVTSDAQTGYHCAAGLGSSL